ncbi:MAG: tRNA dihydrouridine(20/20a) synthase DusA [Myxococcota bacterium]
MRAVSVAPMMDRTDRFHRWMMRLLTRETLLYTEMVTTRAVLHGDRDLLLKLDPVEHPIAVQLGGDDPHELAEAAKIAVEVYGYDEVNLNVGCPSDRVQRGRFGACLMAHPEVVAEGVAAMQQAVDVPVTVKHRIGIDDIDQYEHMLRFVDVVAAAGCERFTVHARKAWLKGLSPKQNRNVPPLRHEEIWRLKRERPSLFIETNGGVKTHDAIARHLEHLDAVMIGRAAWDTPYLFAEMDSRYFNRPDPGLQPDEVVHQMLDFTMRWMEKGLPAHRIYRPALNIFAGTPGSRAFKRVLSERHREDPRVLLPAALEAVERSREISRQRHGDAAREANP